MNFSQIRFSFLIITVVTLFALLLVAFDVHQNVQAQSATAVATSPALNGNSELVFVDPQLLGKNYGYTILDPDSKSSVQIKLPTPLLIRGLTLSPDGKSVAFSAQNIQGDQIYNVYVLNTNGSNLRQLSKDTRGKGGIVSDNGVPGWSPDSKQLIFTHSETALQATNPQLKVSELLLANADGSGTPQVIQPDSAVSFPPSSAAPFNPPAWSPDGKRILFVGVPGTNPAPSDFGTVIGMDVDGKNTALFNQIGLFPAWSPDGKQVALVSLSSIKSVMITDADGSNPKTITLPSEVGSVLNAAWSPDGTQFAFGGTGTGPHMGHIFTMNIDGSGLKVVADIGNSSAFISWGLLPADALIGVPQGTATKTPIPTRTPKPSKTPKPSSTPKTMAQP